MTMALGTARWSNEREAYALKYDRNHAGKDADFLVGVAAAEIKNGAFDKRVEKFFVGGRTDQHALVCMGARGGKGTSILVPNLLEWRGSVVVIDPKGENATITASRRGEGSEYAEGLGQKVVVLDPFKVAQVAESLRGSFNPLDAIRLDSDDAIDEAARIADAIIVQEDAKDAHWNESARYLIKGLILHVLTAPEFEGRRNLISVRSLLVRGDWLGIEDVRTANKEREENGEETIPEPNPFELLWLGMTDNEALDHVIAGVGQSFRSMADKERESVLSTAKRHTEFIESPPMRRCLESSSFALSELKTDPKGVSLFLSLPTRYMSTHHRWLRMLVTLILDEMEKVAHQPRSGRPVLMILDEFPGLGRMKRIEDANSQIPGYGVKLVFVCQSLSQLKEVYKSNWETFMACCGIAIFAANQDEMTLKYLSQRLGQAEIVRVVSSSGTSSNTAPGHFFGSSGSQSGTSEQIHKRALLNEDEIAQMFASNTRLALVLMSGAYPFRVVRPIYHEMESFAGKYDPHPDHPAPPTLAELKARQPAPLPAAPAPAPRKSLPLKPIAAGVFLTFVLGYLYMTSLRTSGIYMHPVVGLISLILLPFGASCVVGKQISRETIGNGFIVLIVSAMIFGLWMKLFPPKIF